MLNKHRAPLILIAAILILGLWILYDSNLQNYGRFLTVSIDKFPQSFDYSCNTADYELLVKVLNTGSKTVDNLTVRLSSPLCVGSVPAVAVVIQPGQTIQLYLQSSSRNGSVFLTGNSTVVTADF